MSRSLLFLCVGLLVVNLCSADSIDVCKNAAVLRAPDMVSGNTQIDPVVIVSDFGLELPCRTSSARSLIWSISSPHQVTVIFDTSDLSADDTFLELLQGSCTALTCVAVDDDSGESFRARLQATLEANTQYYVLLHNHSSASRVNSGLAVTLVTPEICAQTCLGTSPCITTARTGCTACAEPRFLNTVGNQLAGSCDYYCPDGMFEDVSDRTCKPCEDGCARCDADGNCFECKTTTEDVEMYLAGNACVEACPPGRFANAELNFCVLCKEECAECDSEAVCTRCEDNFFLSEGECVRSCPVKFFEDTSGEAGICSMCVSPCDDCTGPTSTECVTCIDNFFYLDGECVGDCGMGHYESGRFCAACHDLCEEGCSGPTRADCAVLQ